MEKHVCLSYYMISHKEQAKRAMRLKHATWQDIARTTLVLFMYLDFFHCLIYRRIKEFL